MGNVFINDIRKEFAKWMEETAKKYNLSDDEFCKLFTRIIFNKED